MDIGTQTYLESFSETLSSHSDGSNLARRFNRNHILANLVVIGPERASSQSPGLPLWATLGVVVEGFQPQRGCELKAVRQINGILRRNRFAVGDFVANFPKVA